MREVPFLFMLEHGVEHGPEHGVEHAPERGVDHSPEHGVEHGPEHGVDHAPEQILPTQIDKYGLEIHDKVSN